MDGAPTPLVIERLLQHEGWVRALARSLVEDEHRVDDVVQKTWLAALERPPRKEGAVRAWLLTGIRRFSSRPVTRSAAPLR